MTEFKASIPNDFRTHWLLAAAESESVSVGQASDWYDGEDLRALSKRISGQVVTLVQDGTDVFEKEDNNFVMLPGTYERLEPNP